MRTEYTFTSDTRRLDTQVTNTPVRNIQNLHYSYDKAGNITYVSSDSPQASRATFEVSSQDCDTNPPTLESFSLSPATVSNASASEILVSAVVRDEGSGTISVSGWAKGPVSNNGEYPRITFSCVPTLNDPEAPWTGTILVPQYAAKGTWRVSLVRLQDRASNTKDYTPDEPVMAQGLFEVQ